MPDDRMHPVGGRAALAVAQADEAEEVNDKPQVPGVAFAACPHREPDASYENHWMSLLQIFHSVATGSRRKRELLTPVGFIIFGLSLTAVVVLGLWTDRFLRMPELLPGNVGAGIGVVLFVLGCMLCGWCVLRFRRAKGTPVPFNPPTELIVAGPYLWMRNPMVTAVFTALFGIGFILHSASIVFIWTPLYILAHIVELKTVEEPELELRFGAAYRQYKRSVPMFLPSPWRRGSSRAG